MKDLPLTLILETIAAISALLYVVLASKQSYFCWPVSILSTVIYTILYFNVQLYLESVLQLFYLYLGVYGWINWKKHTIDNKVWSDSLKNNILWILLLSILSIILAFLAEKYTNTSLPYFDAPVFVFSLYATYITVKKRLESWIFWIVIDLVSSYVYFIKELKVTSVLFFIYVVLAIYGYLEWKKAKTLQTQTR